MRFFRLTPNHLHLQAEAWRRSRDQSECCVAACCEAGARHAASVLRQAEGVPADAEDAASPWLLPRLVTCVPLAEVPAITTDPRLAPAQRAALQQGRPTEVPALAKEPATHPADPAAEARLVQALAALAEAFRSVGHAEAGQRMLATVAHAWSEIAPREAPAAEPAPVPRTASQGKPARTARVRPGATLPPRDA